MTQQILKLMNLYIIWPNLRKFCSNPANSPVKRIWEKLCNKQVISFSRLTSTLCNPHLIFRTPHHGLRPPCQRLSIKLKCLNPLTLIQISIYITSTRNLAYYRLLLHGLEQSNETMISLNCKIHIFLYYLLFYFMFLKQSEYNE